MKHIMATFNPDRLKALMENHGLSGRKLAQRVGLTNVSISRILHGKQKPSRPTVTRLAEAFGIEPESFYADHSPSESQRLDPLALAARRSSKRLTQQQLARAIGVETRRIADLEAGREICQNDLLEDLAQALDVEARSLRWAPAAGFQGQRLRSLRQQRGITPGALAAAAGIDAQRILLWEVDEQTPSAGAVARIEQLLGLAGGELMAEPAWPVETPEASAPSRAQTLRRIQELMERLSVWQCLQVQAYAQGLAAQQGSRGQSAPPEAAQASGPEQDADGQLVEISAEELPADRDWRLAYVPVIDNIAARAGSDTVQAEDFPPGSAESFVAYPNAPEGAFAVRVSGDSMAPTYADGDMIVVNPHQQVSPGEVAVVLYQKPDSGTRLSRLKRLRLRGDKVLLESLNPDYPAVTLEPEQLIHACPVLAHLARRPGLTNGPDSLAGVRALVRRHRGRRLQDPSQSA
jgi:transcriptional regulator with XRE-family HTH domain